MCVFVSNFLFDLLFIIADNNLRVNITSSDASTGDVIEDNSLAMRLRQSALVTSSSSSRREVSPFVTLMVFVLKVWRSLVSWTISDMSSLIAGFNEIM